MEARLFVRRIEDRPLVERICHPLSPAQASENSRSGSRLVRFSVGRQGSPLLPIRNSRRAQLRNQMPGRAKLSSAKRDTTSVAHIYRMGSAAMAYPRTRFPRGLPSRLDTLIAALGGTAEAARLFDRHPSTICRWRSGARPLPARVANRMRELAIEITQELTRFAYELKTDIREGEERALKPRGYRAHAARGGYSPERWARMSEHERDRALELFRLREIERSSPWSTPRIAVPR